MRLILIMGVMLGACAVYGDEFESSAEHQAVAEPPTDPMVNVQWLIGPWRCDVRYFNDAPYRAHRTTGVLNYDVLEISPEHASLVGSYVERPVDGFPVASYTDRVEVDFTTVINGEFAVTSFERTATDGSHVTASGRMTGPFFTSDGAIVVQGTQTYANFPAKPWNALIVSHDEDMPPTGKFMNNFDRAGVDATNRFFQYRQAECFPSGVTPP
jgi:hypothetical protein